MEYQKMRNTLNMGTGSRKKSMSLSRETVSDIW